MGSPRAELFRRHAEMDTPPWASRAHALARLIPFDASVVDAGAGSGYLGQILKGRAAAYYPADVVGRAGMVTWNIAERPAPRSLRGHDVVVCAGVLEYLADPARALQHLRPCAQTLLVTYNLKELRKHRKGHNTWRSALTLPQLRRALSNSGWIPAYSERPNVREIIVRSVRHPLPDPGW